MKSNHSIEMFEELAPKYDFMNSVITFGLYKKWQKKLVEQINPKEGEKILDTATGTGDIAILLSRKKADIFASDLSLNMLKIGHMFSSFVLYFATLIQPRIVRGALCMYARVLFGPREHKVRILSAR